ncbi:MAG: hypothetical protein QXT77_07220 [Candidatus Methanomethylicaceae archaeon]
MRTRMISVERLEQIAITAIQGGYGRVETWRDTGRVRRLVRLAISMDCEDPHFCELHARYSGNHYKRVKPLTVVIESRCRKCAACKERRRVFWAARAKTEWTESALSLFGTLTFSPENDMMLDARARLRLSALGVDFDALPPAELFRERVKEAGAEVTLWLKRLRNSDRRRKLRPRYLMVAEAHSSARTSELKRGRPHFHILLHQQIGAEALVLPHEWAVDRDGNVRTDKLGNPLLADTSFLKAQWKLGFSSFALCRSPQAAAYLCKYLTKEETSTRIRASFRYGTRGEAEASERSDARSPSTTPLAGGPTMGA